MSKSNAVCQHCGCTEIEEDSARGDSVCTNCGSVLAENAIVSEIEFQETGGGAHAVIGQYVSADAPGKLYMGGMMGMPGRESREITLQAGKRKIVELASQLRLNQHCIDTAFNFFKLAVARGITKGRRSTLITASCVYITCRIEGTPHLLVDFCDVLQVGVYELGKVSNFLSRSLYITLPLTDPCIYVMRFSHGLNFQEKEPEITMMALRLVQRMKRDWLAFGRRPTGLCGAALLLAARFYNVSRSVADIVRVVKVGEAVVRRRLREFQKTPSSALTLEEFQTVDLEESADPPSFTEARRKTKQQQQDNEAMRIDLQKLLDYEKQVEAALSEEPRKTKGGKQPQFSNNAFAVNAACTDEHELSDADRFIQDEIVRDVLEMEANMLGQAGCSSSADLTPSQRFRLLAPTLESLGLKEKLVSDITAVVSICPSSNTDGAPALQSGQDAADGELDLSGINDDELNEYLLTPVEVAIKTKIWNGENEQFLIDKEEQRRKRAEEESEKREREGEKKKRKRRKPMPMAASAGEAIEKIVQERKLSSKINYEVLKSLTVCSSPFPSGPPPSSEFLAIQPTASSSTTITITMPSSEGSELSGGSQNNSATLANTKQKAIILPSNKVIADSATSTAKRRLPRVHKPVVMTAAVSNYSTCMPPPTSPAPKRITPSRVVSPKR